MTLKYHIFLPILLETKRLYMHQRHLLVCGDIFIIPARALLFIYVQWTFFSWKMAQSCHGIIAGISERLQILSARVPPEHRCSANCGLFAVGASSQLEKCKKWCIRRLNCPHFLSRLCNTLKKRCHWGSTFFFTTPNSAYLYLKVQNTDLQSTYRHHRSQNRWKLPLKVLYFSHMSGV